MTQFKCITLGLSVCVLLAMLASAIEMRPQANINMTVKYNLTYVNSLCFANGLCYNSGSAGNVSAVTATAPITSTGGATPDIGLTQTGDVLCVGGVSCSGSNLLPGTTDVTITAPEKPLVDASNITGGTISNVRVNTTYTITSDECIAGNYYTYTSGCTVIQAMEPTVNAANITAGTISNARVNTTYAITSDECAAGQKYVWTTGCEADTDGTVTAVTGAAPITSSGGNTPEIGLTLLGDLATTAPITGAANDIFPGADGAKATIGITVLKDLLPVAGSGLTGGENDVFPGADADVLLSIDSTVIANWTGAALKFPAIAAFNTAVGNITDMQVAVALNHTLLDVAVGNITEAQQNIATNHTLLDVAVGNLTEAQQNIATNHTLLDVVVGNVTQNQLAIAGNHTDLDVIGANLTATMNAVNTNATNLGNAITTNVTQLNLVIGNVTGIPNCGAGELLNKTVAGFVCQAAGGGGGAGTVTSVDTPSAGGLIGGDITASGDLSVNTTMIANWSEATIRYANWTAVVENYANWTGADAKYGTKANLDTAIGNLTSTMAAVAGNHTDLDTMAANTTTLMSAVAGNHTDLDVAVGNLTSTMAAVAGNHTDLDVMGANLTATMNAVNTNVTNLGNAITTNVTQLNLAIGNATRDTIANVRINSTMWANWTGTGDKYVDAAGDTMTGDLLLGAKSLNFTNMRVSNDQLLSANTITLKVSGDTDDYLSFITASDAPYIEAIGGGGISFSDEDIGGTAKFLGMANGDETFYMYDDTSDFLYINLVNSTNAVDFKTPGVLNLDANADTGDYVQVSSDGTNPRIGVIGGGIFNLTTDGGAMNLILNGDVDDYLQLLTATNAPYMKVIGGGVSYLSNDQSGAYYRFDALPTQMDLYMRSDGNRYLYFELFNATGNANIVATVGNITIQPTDTDDYLEFATPVNIPIINIVGGAYAQVKPTNSIGYFQWGFDDNNAAFILRTTDGSYTLLSKYNQSHATYPLTTVLRDTNGTIAFQPSGDTDDYLGFYTAGNIPHIGIYGGEYAAIQTKTGGADTHFLVRTDDTRYADLAFYNATDAKGNTLEISTTHGAISLLPSGDTDDYITVSSAGNQPWIGTSGGSYLGLGNTNISGNLYIPINTVTGLQIYQSGNVPYIKTTGEYGPIFTSDQPSDAMLRIWHTTDATGAVSVDMRPDNNASKAVGWAAPTGAAMGMRFYAQTAGHQHLSPYGTNAYDFGTASLCWQDLYYYTLNDCGSPTKNIKGEALPLVKQLAKAHKDARIEAMLFSSTSAGATTFYEEVPDEFQGDYGSCGHNVTITDEVINGLVMAVDELDERVTKQKTDDLQRRIMDLEREVEALKRKDKGG